jgi:hypothetical protein
MYTASVQTVGQSTFELIDMDALSVRRGHFFRHKCAFLPRRPIANAGRNPRKPATNNKCALFTRCSESAESPMLYRSLSQAQRQARRPSAASNTRRGSFEMRNGCGLKKVTKIQKIQTFGNAKASIRIRISPSKTIDNA